MSGSTLNTPLSGVLEGVSLVFLYQLALKLGLSCGGGQLTVDDIATADEVLLTSTPPCVLPVTRFEGQPIGTGQPGPIYRRLLEAWSDAVGVDIRGQMQRPAGEPRTP